MTSRNTRARPFYRRATTVTYAGAADQSASGLDDASSQGHHLHSCLVVYAYTIIYERRAYTIIIMFIHDIVYHRSYPSTNHPPPPPPKTTRNSTGLSVLDAVVTEHASLNIIIYTYVTSSEKESRAPPHSLSRDLVGSSSRRRYDNNNNNVSAEGGRRYQLSLPSGTYGPLGFIKRKQQLLQGRPVVVISSISSLRASLCNIVVSHHKSLSAYRTYYILYIPIRICTYIILYSLIQLYRMENTIIYFILTIIICTIVKRIQ